MNSTSITSRIVPLSLLFLLVSCGSDDMKSMSSSSTGGSSGNMDESGGSSGMDTGTHPVSEGTAQLPAMGEAKVSAWLESGKYKSWACEPEVHEARSPSPHGFNRICSNDVLAANATGTGSWPVGAAAVKELYASADATAPVGYAVYSKTKEDSADGANWYWYEIVPDDSAAPHDANGVVADGLGNGSPALSICVGCHLAAGSDAAHTPSIGGRDQVYTPVAM